ncbi:MAG: glycosyltransferase family 4 protein, partial [Maricaulis sp.]|nr:glycosyltransferase family 4 protein [Maricaulis sp.]
MKILMVHSRYQELGGEDISTRNEARLLRDTGHAVELVEYDNHEVEQMGAARAGLRAIWSRTARRDLSARLAGGGFDILHVQNYLPMVSPAVLRLGKRYGVATVQALRNYRLICTKAQFFRDGKDCHDCLGKTLPWAGIKHRCYRDSLPATLALTGMIATHRALGTWSRETDAFIAVSEYVRCKYLEGGFDPARVHAKPNVVAAAGPASTALSHKLVYVGRLSAEKGIDVLIEAWRRAGVEGELVIAGDGPAREALGQQAADLPGVRFL